MRRGSDRNVRRRLVWIIVACLGCGSAAPRGGSIPADAGPEDGATDGGGEDNRGQDAAVPADAADLIRSDVGLPDGRDEAACPALETACTGELACSSGDPIDLGCREVRTCRQGVWRTSWSFLACGERGGEACPGTAPTTGSPCTLPAHVCSYPTGTCSCRTGCESGADAGGCMRPLVWHCEPPPPPPCPAQAPRWGSACSSEGTGCRYSPPCVEYEVICHQGTWQPRDPRNFGQCS
jgi:hypothetical protein